MSRKPGHDQSDWRTAYSQATWGHEINNSTATMLMFCNCTGASTDMPPQFKAQTRSPNGIVQMYRFECKHCGRVVRAIIDDDGELATRGLPAGLAASLAVDNRPEQIENLVTFLTGGFEERPKDRLPTSAEAPETRARPVALTGSKRPPRRGFP